MWEYLDGFLLWTRTRLDPPPVGKRTPVKYRSMLRAFRNWQEGRELTQALLQEYAEYLRFERPGRHGGPGQRPRTIKGAFTALGAFFRWLEEEQGIAGLPAPGKVKRPRVNKADHGGFRPPTDAEAKAIFKAVDSLPGYTLEERFLRARAAVTVCLGIDCGLRRNEVLGLDLTDLLQEAEWRVNVRYGKEGQHRTVMLNARSRRYTEGFLELREEWVRQREGRRRNPALLPVDARRRIDEDTVHHLRHRLLEMAGLAGQPIRFHDLRAFRLSGWLGINGVNPATVAQMAGHSDPATTLGYARYSEQEMLKAIRESAGGIHENGDGGRPREKRKPKRQRPGGPRARWA